MKKQGFTLIELLIVVAIIAILAAIAIPNFLQAQVRAKVARAQADLRTVATAMETYYVDNNRYVDDWSQQKDDPASQFPGYLNRLIQLTSPVAYMSSVPSDPFAASVIVEGGNLAGPYSYVDGTLAYPLTFDYAKYDHDLDDTNQGYEDAAFELVAEYTFQLTPQDAQRITWCIRSLGPDGESTPFGYTTCVPYDPTNGTTSPGEIVRSNLGQQ